jgi:DDE superfamily endonuclease
MAGPFTGPTNDWSMYQRSGVEDAIRALMEGYETLYTYGDPAYRDSFGVACPFTDPRGQHWLPKEQQHFNKALPFVRIAIEQSFGRTQVLWTYTAFNKGLTAS